MGEEKVPPGPAWSCLCLEKARAALASRGEAKTRIDVRA